MHEKYLMTRKSGVGNGERDQPKSNSLEFLCSTIFLKLIKVLKKPPTKVLEFFFFARVYRLLNKTECIRNHTVTLYPIFYAFLCGSYSAIQVH